MSELQELASLLANWAISSASWDISKQMLKSLYDRIGKKPLAISSFDKYLEANELLDHFISLYSKLDRDVDEMVELTFDLVIESKTNNRFGAFDYPKKEIIENEIISFSTVLNKKIENTDKLLEDISSLYSEIESNYSLLVMLLAHNLPSQNELFSIINFESSQYNKLVPETIAKLPEDKRIDGIIQPAGGLNYEYLPKGLRGRFHLLDWKLAKFLTESFAGGKWYIGARHISILDIDRLVLLLIQARDDDGKRWIYIIRIFIELRKLDFYTKYMLNAIKNTSSDLLTIKETGNIEQEIELRMVLHKATNQLAKFSTVLREIRNIDNTKHSEILKAVKLESDSRSLLVEASRKNISTVERLSKARLSEKKAKQAKNIVSKL